MKRYAYPQARTHTIIDTKTPIHTHAQKYAGLSARDSTSNRYENAYTYTRVIDTKTSIHTNVIDTKTPIHTHAQICRTLSKRFYVAYPINTYTYMTIDIPTRIHNTHNRCKDCEHKIRMGVYLKKFTERDKQHAW